MVSARKNRSAAGFLGVVLFAAAALMVALAPEAYAGKKIGVIMTGDIPYYHSIHSAFTAAVRGTADIEIIVQTPAPEPMAWANSAKKLVTVGADIIVTYGAPATLTTMKATSSIPILFAGVYDPEAMQISGKNATGISSEVSMESLINDLKQIANVSKLGVIFNKTEKDTILQVKEINRLKGKLGFEVELLDVRAKDFEKAMGGLDALIFTTSCGAMCSVEDIVAAARSAGIPCAATISGGEEKGIILTLAADPVEQGRAVAEMALKVLGGADPSGIAVRKASKIEFVVNLKAAQAMGINVPSGMAGSATRVIR